MSIQPWQARVPLIGPGGRASTEWIRWLQQLLSAGGTIDSNAASITTLESLVATLQAAVKALESAPSNALALETNYAPNANQSKLDLVAGSNISIWDTGSGDVIISATGGGDVGSVTSVDLSMPAEFTVSGSPITGAGTLTVTKANENPNTVYAGPSSGAAAQPGFRAQIVKDFPFHDESLTDGNSNFIFAAGDIVTVVGVPN